jgi:hypothetical protein
MLFDLRTGARRRTVKLVYLGLAFLMFAGFVGFSIGSSGISGGIIDAITQGGGGGGNSNDRFTQRVQAADRFAHAHPSDAGAWAALARARFQLAGVGGNYDSAQNTYTDAGKAQLQKAGDAWDRYLALNPPKPDDRVASLMVQAFSELNKPAEAVTAQEIITQVRPKAATFAQLAVFAYQAGQTNKGDLAAKKALSLTPKDQRAALKGQLDQAKSQAAGSAAAGASGGSSGGG